VGILKKKIQSVTDFNSLVVLIRDNYQRFYDEDGGMDKVVGDFMKYARDKRSGLQPRVRISFSPLPAQPTKMKVEPLDARFNKMADLVRLNGYDKKKSLAVLQKERNNQENRFQDYYAMFMQYRVKSPSDIPGVGPGVEKESAQAAWSAFVDHVKKYDTEMKQYEDRAKVETNPKEKVQPIDSKDSADVADKSLPEEPDTFTMPPAKDSKQISGAINDASPENRNRIQRELMGNDGTAETVQEQKENMPYEYTPGKVTVSNFGEALDYTKVVPLNISLANPKKILEIPKPSYIPDVDADIFKRAGYKLPGVKLAEDQYLILVDKPAYNSPKNMSVDGNDMPQYVVVSRDVLAATQHYYFQKVKAEYKVRKDENTKKKVEEAKVQVEEYRKKKEAALQEGNERKAKMYGDYESYFQDVIDGSVKPKFYEKAPRLMSDNKMSYTQMGILQNAGYARNARQTGQKSIWDGYKEFTEDLKQKMSDMQIQYEDDMNAHSKGEETSYGDQGLKGDLLDSHGVMVKRQNGDDITSVEIKQIQKALSYVYGTFGDRSSMAKNFGLKISHSGDVLMHARKAVGIFFPAYKAIGVSAKYGDNQFGFTLSHEFAHFMDNYLGTSQGHHYASDKAGSTTNSIADTFRKNMKQKKQSDYQNRTCECFARALEQYFAIKNGQGEDYQKDVNAMGNHPTNEAFKETVMPKIEAWFKENDQLLKSCSHILTFRRI
jgi:hypothetical protein